MISHPVEYIATVKGNAAPYKWTLSLRKGPSRSTLASGEASTFESACSHAAERAHQHEIERSWNDTVEDVVVLVIPPKTGTSAESLHEIPVSEKTFESSYPNRPEPEESQRSNAGEYWVSGDLWGFEGYYLETSD